MTTKSGDLCQHRNCQLPASILLRHDGKTEQYCAICVEVRRDELASSVAYHVLPTMEGNITVCDQCLAHGELAETHYTYTDSDGVQTCDRCCRKSNGQ